LVAIITKASWRLQIAIPLMGVAIAKHFAENTYEDLYTHLLCVMVAI